MAGWLALLRNTDGASSGTHVGSQDVLRKSVVEIRFHGRGGQGAVTAATLLVAAAVIEGKWGQAIPSFGAERRGAHVLAYARVSDKAVPLHSQVKKPDIIVVLDPSLILVQAEREKVLAGASTDTIVVANIHQPISLKGVKFFYVDATRIARELGLVIAGWPVVNTSMLGALAKASGIVSVDSVVKAIKNYWPGRLGEANAEAAKRAYQETVPA